MLSVVTHQELLEKLDRIYSVNQRLKISAHLRVGPELAIEDLLEFLDLLGLELKHELFLVFLAHTLYLHYSKLEVGPQILSQGLSE
jgi:hypothetical protein